MTKIILVSHAAFCQGLLESYKMIAGENDCLSALSLDMNGIADFKERITKEVAKKVSDDPVLILCDIKGGTPFNEAYNLYLQNPEKIRVISGMNLPMVIETGMQVSNVSDLDQLYDIALNTGKESIEGINEESNKEEEIEF